MDIIQTLENGNEIFFHEANSFEYNSDKTKKQKFSTEQKSSDIIHTNQKIEATKKFFHELKTSGIIHTKGDECYEQQNENTLISQHADSSEISAAVAKNQNS